MKNLQDFRSFGLKLFRAQLFEGQLVLNPGLNLTRVSFSLVQKHFLTIFCASFRASNHQLVDIKN